MLITKPRNYKIDTASVIIFVLTIIAVIVATCRYNANKFHIEDTEVIETTPSVLTEEKPLIPLERIVAPTVIESEPPKVETTVESEIEYISLGEFKITAYCACKKCCGKWADSRPLDDNGDPIVCGASGRVLIPGYSIAVDPNVIPYGTKVYVDGREYIAHDTGGAIDGNRIDFYMGSHKDSHENAVEWGVQYREIFIKKD